MLDINEIKKIIPHRYPFLLIDKVEITSDKNITGYKCVSGNEEFFAGHFPDNPVMPGVLIMEALAQTGAVYILSKDEFAGKTAYFGAMDNVKFKEMVRPGDVLKLCVSLEKLKGPVGVAKGEAYVGDKLAASGMLTFIIK